MLRSRSLPFSVLLLLHPHLACWSQDALFNSFPRPLHYSLHLPAKYCSSGSVSCSCCSCPPKFKPMARLGPHRQTLRLRRLLRLHRLQLAQRALSLTPEPSRQFLPRQHFVQWPKFHHLPHYHLQCLQAPNLQLRLPRRLSRPYRHLRKTPIQLRDEQTRQRHAPTG